VDDAPRTATPRVLADRYTLLAPIGSGGAGVVWRAHDRVLDRTVAVKLLHPDIARDPATAARFRAEASAAAKLTHPHAVIVYDIGTVEGQDYLVMEMVEGVTIADLLPGGPLSPGAVAAIGSQVAQALGMAHARGLVHRDVKPANVLLTRTGVAKVADFGIARALGEATSRLTTPGHVMGTARYLAPEQLRDQQVDARADVYALGLLLHQTLTGQPPFGDGTAVEVASRRLVASLPRASQQRSGIPRALDDVIACATQLDPADRFASGAEFASARAPLVGPDAAAEVADRVAGAGPSSAGGGGAPVVAPRPTVAASVAAAGPDRPALRSGGDPDADGGPVTVALPTASSPQPGRETLPRAMRWLVVVAIVSAIVGIGFLAGGGREPDAGDEPSDVVAGNSEEDAQPATVPVVDGGDHDPLGDGEEHPGDVPNAFDGDRATSWQTQRYRGDPRLGGLKDGVGIWFDLGDPVAVAEVLVVSPEPGASFTLYAGDDPPDAGQVPGDWGSEVARVEDAETESRIRLDEPIEARAWLVWFTSLPPDGSQFRARVSEIVFTAG
jgi:eukaryotic-like serine/threonine-protein kinase